MDIISFNEASTANGRIESFIENPDSSSGIVTTPKVIAIGETVTIPVGRMAVLPNLQIDGTLDIQGDVFIPSGSTFDDLDSQIALKAPLASPVFTGTPTAPTQTAGDNSTKLATTAYVDGKMVMATAVTASGTSIDFTGIPSWVKRITVMFDNLSTSGSSIVKIQIGAGGIANSGYISSCSNTFGQNQTNITSSTTGFTTQNGNALLKRSGQMFITKISDNSWISSCCFGGDATAPNNEVGGGSITLSGVLDRIRITTSNGTDTFDNGKINIMYEG